MKIMNYVFGMNYNPIVREEEGVLTEIRIPAQSEEEARARLKELVGGVMAKRFCLNDIRDY